MVSLFQWTRVSSLAVAVLLGSNAALADFEGSVSFTAQEVAKHQSQLPLIMKEATDCLKDDLDRHQTFHDQFGISPFYGSLSAFSKMTNAERIAKLESLGLPGSLVKQLEPTSCVGLTMKCMGRAFETAGMASTWKKLADFTKKNGVDGSALQDGLRKLGWKVLYWNPNISKNKQWDDHEKKTNPTNKLHAWGYHEYRWSTVSGPNHKYYYNVVDDYSSLVNFGTQVPTAFANVPFFVGTAHTGYHVFPGMYGRVIEGHSMRDITDSQTIESSPFNPLKNGGGPRGDYMSGLIAVPPGYGF